MKSEWTATHATSIYVIRHTFGLIQAALDHSACDSMAIIFTIVLVTQANEMYKRNGQNMLAMHVCAGAMSKYLCLGFGCVAFVSC